MSLQAYKPTSLQIAYFLNINLANVFWEVAND